MGATSYATNYLQFYKAMKAADPSIKVGVVLTTPGNWPDGVVASQYGDTMDWNHTVLSIIKDDYDFAIVHFYPGSGASEQAIFGDLADIPAWMATLHQEMAEYVPDASSKQVLLTETDSSNYLDGQVDAMWAPLDESAWLENGVTQVDWWDEHNGIGTPNTDPDGRVDYEDQGILSNGSASGAVSEPPANTPFRTYYGLVLQHDFAPPGSRFLGSTSANAGVYAYAARPASGRVNVLLANPSTTATYNVRVLVGGRAARGAALVDAYGDASSSITTSREVSQHGFALPPGTVEVVHLRAPGPGL
jgi:hypothetical protein